MYCIYIYEYYYNILIYLYHTIDVAHLLMNNGHKSIANTMDTYHGKLILKNKRSLKFKLLYSPKSPSEFQYGIYSSKLYINSISL